MIRWSIPLALVLATAAAAQTAPADQRASARLADALAGYAPGTPRRCIEPRRVQRVEGYPTTILYHEGNRRIWRSEVGTGCRGLKRGDQIVTTSFGPDYCQGDIVKTRARVGGTLSGSCALGEFVPYERVAPR